MAEDKIIIPAELQIQLDKAEKELDGLKKKYQQLLLDDSTSPLALRRTREALMGAQKEVDKLKKEMDDFGKKNVPQATKELENMSSVAGRMARTMAGLFSIKLAKDFAAKVVQTRGQFQQLEVAFETMLGSKEKADALMSQALEFAAKTPYSVSDVAAGAKQLLAYGVESKDIMKTLRQCGDVASGLSLSLNRVVSVYGRVQAQGKLTGRTLIQFTSAGIPIVKQLAEQLGKSETQIRQMISAGKVGFPMIKKAFEDMTGEGGKFGNLMEKQSKTITGRISNIEDAIEHMFNDIGKATEGPIGSVLDLTLKLVENYEKVGKAIAGVVAAYGVERAALMVYAAAKTTAAKATVKDTIAKVANTATTEGAAKAQVALNKAILSSPYVWAAAAVAAMTAGIARLALHTSEAEKAQAQLKDSEGMVAAEAAKELADLERLKAAMASSEKGSKSYKDAKKKLIDQFGKYNKNLGTEIENVNKQAKAYDNLTKSIEKAARVKVYQTYVSTSTENINTQLSKNLPLIEKRLQEYFGSEGAEAAGTLFSRVRQYVYGEIKELDHDEWKTLEKAGNLWERTFGIHINTMVMDAEKGYRALRTLREDAKRIFGITDEDIDKYGGDGGGVPEKPEKPDKSDKERQQAYNRAKRAEELDKRMSRERIKANQQNEQAEIDAMEEGAAKRLRQAKLNYEKEADAINQAREDYKKEVIERQKQEWMEGGDRKEFDFRPDDDAVAEAMKAYDEMLDKRSELNDKKYNEEKRKIYEDQIKQYGTYGQQRLLLEVEWERKIAEQKQLVQNAANDKERAQQQQFLEQMQRDRDAALANQDYEHFGELGSFGIQMRTLKDKFAAEIAKSDPALRDGLLRRLRDEMEALVQSYAESGQSLDFAKWYNSLADESLSELEKQLTLARIILLEAEELGADTSDEETKRKLEEAQAKVVALEQKIRELTNSTKTATINWKEMTDVLKDASSAFANLGKEIGGVAGAIISDIGQMASATAELSNEIHIMTTSTDSMEVLAAGIAGVGAAVSMISIVVGVIKQNKAAADAAAEATRNYEIALKRLSDTAQQKRYDTIFGGDSFGSFAAYNQQLQDASKNLADLQARLMGSEKSLEDWYETLGKFFTPGTFGIGTWSTLISTLINGGVPTGNLISDKRSDFEKFMGFQTNISVKNLSDFMKDGKLDIEALKAWYAEWGDGMEEEQKDIVDELITEWERYEEATKAMADYMKSVFGNTATSIADEMIESFALTGDAMTGLENIASEVGKNIAKSLATSMIINRVFTPEAQQKITDMMTAGDAANAVNYFNELLENAQAMAPEITEFLRGLNVDWEGERQGATKGIAQASQDSVDELNGRFTVIQQHTFQINDSVKAIKEQNAELVSNSALILLEVRGIHHDTTIIKQAADDIRGDVGDMHVDMAEMRSDISRAMREGVIIKR